MKKEFIREFKNPILQPTNLPEFKVVDSNNKTMTIGEIKDVHSYGRSAQFYIEYEHLLSRTLYESMSTENLFTLHKIITETLLQKIKNKVRPKRITPKDLTERESEIYELILNGLDRNEMAKILNISAITVATHVNTILQKCHVNSKYELMAKHIKSLEDKTNNEKLQNKQHQR